MSARKKMTNWRSLLVKTLTSNGETLSDVVSNTMTDAEMLTEFYDGFGGIPFTVWTSTSVYFPLCYDGSEWVGWVSRNPDGKPTYHQGG